MFIIHSKWKRTLWTLHILASPVLKVEFVPMNLYCTFSTPDIDECSTGHTCDSSASCQNNNGSYTCTCDSGYTGDGHTCRGMNWLSSYFICVSSVVCFFVWLSVKCPPLPHTLYIRFSSHYNNRTMVVSRQCLPQFLHFPNSNSTTTYSSFLFLQRDGFNNEMIYIFWF